ncbi:MAG: ATP-binding cassette domain-containing protein, partial [Acidobacteriota bacterium]
MNDDLQIENSPQKAVSSAFSLVDVRQVRGNQIVLDDINLEIETGKITALIGPSGAGKTSLLRLLNRLDDPASGQIFYNSRPISEYPVQKLRLQVGFVFQTPVMFPGTVADNLRTALEL